MFADDSTNLKRPEPPVGTDPAAVQYANQWYAIWESVRDGHMAPVSAIENGDVPGASSALAQWRQQIEAAATETARLGDFNGNRILVASDDEVHQALEGLVSLVEEYVGQRLNGEVTEDTATDAIGYVIGVHTTMNDAMQAFYNDPTGAGYRAVEDAAFAPLEAMRQQVNPNAPELAPIEGISLHDYVAGAAKMHTGMNADQICQVLGVERPQWERACKGWMERVQQHPMSVGMQYSTLMSQPHPLLAVDLSEVAPGVEGVAGHRDVLDGRAEHGAEGGDEGSVPLRDVEGGQPAVPLVVDLVELSGDVEGLAVLGDGQTPARTVEVGSEVLDELPTVDVVGQDVGARNLLLPLGYLGGTGGLEVADDVDHVADDELPPGDAVDLCRR